jgi:hypothetical protein
MLRNDGALVQLGIPGNRAQLAVPLTVRDPLLMVHEVITTTMI